MISSVAGTYTFVSFETFGARIAPKDFPGTFMTIMNALSNLSS